jgi:hypothetical protein
VLALVLTAASCVAGGDGEDTSTDGSAGSPGSLTASATGVTEDTVRLGVIIVDTEALQDFDVDIDFGPVADQWTAWAAAQNADGGVNGRDLEVVVEEFLPVGNEEAVAACVSLTEDHEVFAVAGQLLDDNPLCVTESHETPYIGGFGLNPERAERSVAPFLATEMAEDLQRRHSTEILIEEGYLDGKRVGVHWGADNAAIAEEIVLPLLEEAGVDVVATSVAENFGTDTQAAQEAMDINIERMRSEGVEVLVNLTNVIPLLTAQQRNDFAPQPVFFNGQATDGGQFEGGGIDPKYLEDAIAITVNKPARDELLADERVATCVEEYNAADPDEPLVLEEMPQSQLRGTALNCAVFEMFVQLAEAAGPDLTGDSLQAAAEDFGPIELPSMPDASLGPGKFSAGNSMRIYEYDAAENEMLPISDPIIVSS